MKGENCNRQILQEIRFLLVELGVSESTIFIYKYGFGGFGAKNSALIHPT